MDSVKRLQVFERFILKMKEYEWQSSDGNSFNYETENLSLRFTSYNLSVDYKNVKEGESDRGITFNTNNHPKLLSLYHELTEASLDNAFDKILDDNPDVKRELGLENLLDE